MLKTMVSVCVLALAVSAAQASLLVAEDFTHPDGNIVGQTPTPGPGGTWAAHSGAGNLPVQVSGGVAVLQQGAGSREDVNTSIGITLGASQTLYGAFDLVNYDNSSTVYFAHFAVSATVFNSRVFIAAPTSGGDYTLGLSNTSTLTATWGSDLSYGETYRIVHSYDYDTAEARLWVNPTDESSPSISVSNGFAEDAVALYALRQATGATSTQWIDNLGVATQFHEALHMVPEPGMILLLGLGAALFRRRR